MTSDPQAPEYHPFSLEVLREDGTLLINEANLTHLEEKLAYLTDRAKYYGEYSLTKPDFLDMLGDLTAIARAIRRTSR